MMASQVPGNRTDQNLMLEDTLWASRGEHEEKMVTIKTIMIHRPSSALSSTKTAFKGIMVRKMFG